MMLIETPRTGLFYIRFALNDFQLSLNEEKIPIRLAHAAHGIADHEAWLKNRFDEPSKQSTVPPEEYVKTLPVLNLDHFKYGSAEQWDDKVRDLYQIPRPEVLVREWFRLTQDMGFSDREALDNILCMSAVPYIVILSEVIASDFYMLDPCLVINTDRRHAGEFSVYNFN